MRAWCVVLVALAPAALGAPVEAGFAFGDRAWFDKVEHTFLDFETRGDGSFLDITFGESLLMDPAEYAAQGVLIGPRVTWKHIPAPAIGTLGADDEFPGEIGDALVAVGSRPIALNGGPLIMEFLTPTRAVGVALVQRNFAFPGFTEAGSVGFRVFGVGGDLLADVRLWGDLIDGFFDGTITAPDGTEFGRIRYGFVGYAGDELIGRIEFANTIDAIVDDLHFSAIPAPGAGTTLGLLTLGALARRRRSLGG